MHVTFLVRRICREASKGCNRLRQARAIASAAKVANVEKLAKADPRLAATVDQWDADPWLLNTPDGVVDLKSGAVRPHQPEDYMTKITKVGLGGTCKRWLNFLAHITDGDPELQCYLQRVAGYALTGGTSEHALFFGYGTGGNGKGTFLNTLAKIWADYAAVASMDTFTESKHERHPTDVAMLQGRRLVTAQETDQGRRWAESRIKTMTGGDPITARHMRQDFFTYDPQFKLFIAGNHKPALQSVDEAIQRRLHLIPFVVTVPKEARDPDLQDKLRAEWSGILQWAIDGCLEWQRVGLLPPPVVLDATKDYLATEDCLSQWIEEQCLVGDRLEASTSALYESWRSWAYAAGEDPGTKNALSHNLAGRGFQKRRWKAMRGFVGIAVKPKET
jgi:putative DNA primase/helicase